MSVFVDESLSAAAHRGFKEGFSTKSRGWWNTFTKERLSPEASRFDILNRAMKHEIDVPLPSEEYFTESIVTSSEYAEDEGKRQGIYLQRHIASYLQDIAVALSSRLKCVELWQPSRGGQVLYEAKREADRLGWNCEGRSVILPPQVYAMIHEMHPVRSGMFNGWKLWVNDGIVLDDHYAHFFRCNKWARFFGELNDFRVDGERTMRALRGEYKYGVVDVEKDHLFTYKLQGSEFFFPNDE